MTYQWYLDSIPINGATAQTLSINQGGNYSVRVSNNNCSSYARLSAVFRFQSGGIAYQIYPNPAQGNFNLIYTLKNTERVNIELQDMAGQKIYTIVNHQLQSPGEHLYNLKENTYHLQKGYYILRIQIGSEKITRKIIVL